MKTSAGVETVRVYRYEAVARRIARLIDRGTLPPGSRIPSVRRLSRDLQVSLSTVLEAYRLLEDQGRIEARPQSGFYVRRRAGERAPEPATSLPAARPTAVSLGELVMMVVRDMRDPNLIQLGGGSLDPELLPAEKLDRVLAAAARRRGAATARYEMPPGCDALRAQIARRMVGAGCALAPDEIVVTSGCQDALVLCLRAVCRPGDTVAVESPCFYGVLQALEMLGLRALELPTHPREGISMAALRLALEHHPVRACALVPSFSNPLGHCMPGECRRELVHILAGRRIPLIEDDIYGDLCFSTERPRTAKSFDEQGLVLLCSSFSKTLSPGYRVGWVAPGRFRAEVERLKFVSSVAAPTLPQIAIAEFLASGGYEHHLRRLRRGLARQVDAMVETITRSFPAGTSVCRPAGGFLVWVELPAQVDGLGLYEMALGRGVTLAPGPIFSANGKYRNCIRLNAGRWSDPIERSVVEIGRLAAGMTA